MMFGFSENPKNPRHRADLATELRITVAELVAELPKCGCGRAASLHCGSCGMNFCAPCYRGHGHPMKQATDNFHIKSLTKEVPHVTPEGYHRNADLGYSEKDAVGRKTRKVLEVPHEALLKQDSPDNHKSAPSHSAFGGADTFNQPPDPYQPDLGLVETARIIGGWMLMWVGYSVAAGAVAYGVVRVMGWMGVRR